MSMVRTPTLCVTLVAGLSSCSSWSAIDRLERDAASGSLPGLVSEHVRLEARAAEGQAARPTPSAPDLEQMTAQIDAVRRGLDQMLAEPATIATFRDFATESARGSRALAGDRAALVRRLGGEFSVEELEAFVFARNRDVAAAKESLDAVVERYPQVVYVEVLVSQYVTFLSDLALGAGPALQRDPVSMKFPAPGVLSLKADLVSRDVDLAREEFERTVRDSVVAANLAFHDLWYVDRAVETSLEILEFLRQLEGTVSSRLETDQADKSSVLQVQVEISSLEDSIITLEERRSTLEARLCELLDVDPSTGIGTPVTSSEPPAMPSDVDGLYRTAREARQEVRAARDRHRRMETAIELAERMVYPDWTLGLGYFEGLGPVGARGRSSASVVPEEFGQRPPGARDFWFGQSESFLRESRKTRDALAADVDAAIREAEFLVRSEVFALDEARRRLDLYDRVLITQARQAYDDASAGYQNGRVEFLNVIDSLRQWLRFDLERDGARRDYRQAYVRLESAIGRSIQEVP